MIMFLSSLHMAILKATTTVTALKQSYTRQELRPLRNVISSKADIC